jgi:hypothetical protein
MRRTGLTPAPPPIDLTILWWTAPFFVVVSLVLTRIVARQFIDARRTSLGLMRGFGDRFVLEFERPLVRRCPAEPAVRSRLRFAPSRRRLEVLLAPADGRTYPNLTDHRKNVQYDVQRVQALLRNEPFIAAPLYAEGLWVVIPFRYETDRPLEGVP